MKLKCYCEEMTFRKCVHCEEANDREEEHRVCSSWNWNHTPRECATEAKELGWSTRQLRSAMIEFGFSDLNVNAVLYEFEVGE